MESTKLQNAAAGRHSPKTKLKESCVETRLDCTTSILMRKDGLKASSGGHAFRLSSIFFAVVEPQSLDATDCRDKIVGPFAAAEVKLPQD